MCGIVAYLGHRPAPAVIIRGLKRLEYRGYDSAGIALLNGSLSLFKKKGKVAELEALLQTASPEQRNAHLGIGHTRWATHGEPNDVNAHPHRSDNGTLVMVHNGIIENYDALKKELTQRGHRFESDTDTEVLIHFIEEIKQSEDCSLEEAVRVALTRVVGAYAIAIMSADEPNTLIAARKGSPLVLGLGQDEFFLASDATPIIEYTNEVVYLNDNEVCSIKGGQFTIKDIRTDLPTTPYVQTLDLHLEAIEKGGYDTFMLKEISYIHAEGYPAAEMKHGPIALVDKEMPVVIIATQDDSYEKVVSNIQEIKARRGQVIAVVTQGDTLIAEMADYVLEVPAAPQLLMPLLSVIPLQLLSYHIATLRGCDVDQPRNLAKSVTVE